MEPNPDFHHIFDTPVSYAQAETIEIRNGATLRGEG
jgi:hypothetical protein